MKDKRIGRPRTRPPDLLVFNTQMTRKAKARLKALAQLEGAAAYRVLEDAFWHRWKDLSESKRDSAELIASTIEKSMREEAEQE